MIYQHDMLHCSQDNCPKKEQCYRFFLGQDFKNHEYQYASFYMPSKDKNLNECEHFINKKEYEE